MQIYPVDSHQAEWTYKLTSLIGTITASFAWHPAIAFFTAGTWAVYWFYLHNLLIGQYPEAALTPAERAQYEADRQLGGGE